MTTNDIIQGCKDKKAIYQKALVKRFAPMLLSVCRRYCGQSGHAQDVLQESLIRIFKSFENFDGSKGSLEGWMRKIAINTALKYFDKNSFKKKVSSLKEAELSTIEPDILTKLQTQDLMRLIEFLPEGYRHVFNLYAIEGYSHKEISTMLGIRESSSRSNLTRARNILKKEIMKLNAPLKVSHEYE